MVLQTVGGGCCRKEGKAKLHGAGCGTWGVARFQAAFPSAAENHPGKGVLNGTRPIRGHSEFRAASRRRRVRVCARLTLRVHFNTRHRVAHVLENHGRHGSTARRNDLKRNHTVEVLAERKHGLPETAEGLTWILGKDGGDGAPGGNLKIPESYT